MLQLLSADEWTLDFMASRPQDFPAADYGGVVARLAQELAAGTRAAELAQLLRQDASLTLDEQMAALCVRDPGHWSSTLLGLLGFLAPDGVPFTDGVPGCQSQHNSREL